MNTAPTLEQVIAGYLCTLIAPGADDRIGRTGVYGRTLSMMTGPKYVRIVATDSAGTRSALAFIEKATGNIWAPDGWKGPARNFPRGNVFKIMGVAAPVA